MVIAVANFGCMLTNASKAFSYRWLVKLEEGMDCKRGI